MKDQEAFLLWSKIKLKHMNKLNNVQMTAMGIFLCTCV